MLWYHYGHFNGLAFFYDFFLPQRLITQLWRTLSQNYANETPDIVLAKFISVGPYVI